MFYPTLEHAARLAKENYVIPVAMELFADQRTSMEILRSLLHKNKQVFLLESVANQESWGRYTFLGYNPQMVLQGLAGKTILKHNGKTQTTAEPPADLLKRILAEHKSPRIEGLPPFTGGLVGYFSYDFVKYCVPGLKLQPTGQADEYDFQLMLIDRVIAFDHFKQKIYLIVNVCTDNLQTNYIGGVAALKDMERLVLEENAVEITPPQCSPFIPDYSQERFCSIVEKTKRYIQEGDIFQAVLSNRFTATCEGNLLHTYRMLRTTNPSPYMVYLCMEDIEIVCASPETLVTLRDGELNAFPLAGTRPRGKTCEQDRQLETELLSDEKELAEHDMLVDLARNDLGKISRFGTVKVREHRAVKRFSHVMHIASRVSGQIQDDRDAVDALMAALPAGTLSGAPKKRACEIIDELENNRRGPYGGAIGYLDFAGNQNFCIAIRMAVRKGNRVTVQAGAGIVADSNPQKEYQEITHKAKAVIQALAGDGEGGIGK